MVTNVAAMTMPRQPAENGNELALMLFPLAEGYNVLVIVNGYAACQPA
jgi:hypothetical protein